MQDFSLPHLTEYHLDSHILWLQLLHSSRIQVCLNHTSCLQPVHENRGFLPLVEAEIMESPFILQLTSGSQHHAAHRTSDTSPTIFTSVAMETATDVPKRCKQPGLFFWDRTPLSSSNLRRTPPCQRGGGIPAVGDTEITNS